MRKMLIWLVALGGLSLIGGLASNAAADPRFDRVDQRQYLQQLRIREGLASGRLTRGEASVLMREQGQIAWFEARAEADGRVTHWERAQLERAQDAASRNIQRFVRNDAFPGRPYGHYGHYGHYGQYGQYR